MSSDPPAAHFLPLGTWCPSAPFGMPRLPLADYLERVGTAGRIIPMGRVGRFPSRPTQPVLLCKTRGPAPPPWGAAGRGRLGSPRIRTLAGRAGCAFVLV